MNPVMDILFGKKSVTQYLSEYLVKEVLKDIQAYSMYM